MKDPDIHVDVGLVEHMFLNKTMSDVQKCFTTPSSLQEIVLDDGWIWFANERLCFVGKGAVVQEALFKKDEMITIVWLKFLDGDWRVIYDVTYSENVTF